MVATRLVEKRRFRSIERWKIVLGLIFCLLLCFEVFLLVRVEKKRMLALQARRTAAQLIDFARARAQLNARSPDEPADQYRVRVAAQNAETESFYAKKFYGQIAQLREEFARRGVTDNELDEFYGKPIYPIGIREVGERLYVMADRTEGLIP